MYSPNTNIKKTFYIEGVYGPVEGVSFIYKVFKDGAEIDTTNIPLAIQSIGDGFYQYQVVFGEEGVYEVFLISDNKEYVFRDEIEIEASSADAIYNTIDLIRKIETNKVTIDENGTRVTIYDDDHTTPLMSFYVNKSRTVRMPIIE